MTIGSFGVGRKKWQRCHAAVQRRAEVVGVVSREAKDLEEPATETLPAEVQLVIKQMQGLKAKDMKEALQELGLDTTTCLDREALLELLAEKGPLAILLDLQRMKKERVKFNAVRKFFGPGEEDTIPLRLLTPPLQGGIAAAKSGKLLVLEFSVMGKKILLVPDFTGLHTVIPRAVIEAWNVEGWKVNPDPPSWIRDENGSPRFPISEAVFENCFFGKVTMKGVTLNLIEAEESGAVSGTAGHLARDILCNFDFDFDIVAKKVRIIRPPTKTFWIEPLKIDVKGMFEVELREVTLPSGYEALVCDLTVIRSDGIARTAALGIIDVAFSRTAINAKVKDVLKLDELTQLEWAKSKGSPWGFSGLPPPPGAKRTSEPDLEKSEATDYPLHLAIGNSLTGSTTITANVVVGSNDAFEGLGPGADIPFCIIGPDVLCQKRLVISLRMMKMWVPR